jgi:hypothetical protein
MKEMKEKNEHFVLDDRRGLAEWAALVAMILFPPLIWAFYDIFSMPKYWRNRVRLHRLLRVDKVKARIIEEGLFELYSLDIEGQEYTAFVWEGKISLDGRKDGRLEEGRSFFGLFAGSMVAKWMSREAVAAIRLLADPCLNRERKLNRLGI